MKKIIVAIALAATTIGGAAIAQTPVNVRQANQERRIDAGTRSGKLTRHEAMRLKAEQRSIRNQEAAMRARHGGHLTARDKRIIHQRQAMANHRILNQKHDGQHGENHLKL